MIPDPKLISYEDFVYRVRRYKRTSLLIACTQVGWRVWSLGERSRLSLQDVHVCRAYIGTVAAIAAAKGTEDRNLLASDGDAIRLCHEFLGIEERPLGPNSSSSHELAELLRASEVFNSYEISDGAVGHATLQLFLGRIFRSQWDSRIAAYQGFWRAWELLRRMYRRGGGDELLRRHTQALRIEPLAYIQGGVALFALLPRR